LDIQTIVAELKGELTRIGQVIGLLENGTPVKKRVGRPPGSATEKVQTERRGRSLTPAGRRKLSEAMKLRWAQRKGPVSASKSIARAAAATTPKKSGGISAAGRKKLSEAMKKRWAEKKRKAS
jgi:hypothetical protein